MKPKIRSTTQHFTEIEQISNDIVYFRGGYACIILETSSVNFYLLSQEEQEARLSGFMAFLNSLNFSVQILINTKSVDIASYLAIIDNKLANETRLQIVEHLKHYREFVQGLIKTKNLLDKKFYVAIPFSNLELGPIPQEAKTHTSKDQIQKQTDTILQNKKVSILTQLQRMGLSARQLTTSEAIKLFYELYNHQPMTIDYDPEDPKNIIL